MSNKTDKLEGFWWSQRETHFPKPVSSNEPFENKEAIVEALKKLQKDIHLHKKGNIVYYKGYSTCRCCKEMAGSTEYSYKRWKWPEGFIHYVEVHNVKPSDKFIEDVLKNFI